MVFIIFKLVFNIEYCNGIEFIMIYFFFKKVYFFCRYIRISILYLYVKFCNLIYLNMKYVMGFERRVVKFFFVNFFIMIFKGF